MMVPRGFFIKEAWAEGLSDTYNTGGAIDIKEDMEYITSQEPEVIFWPDTKSLAVQYHPEWMEEESEGWKYFQELLNKYILV